MPGEAEVVLRGPVGIAMGEAPDGQPIRNVIVTVGDTTYRIPLPLAGAAELSQALAVSDEELREATRRQAISRSLLVPGGNGVSPPS